MHLVTPALPASADLVVVGGGIVGLSAALHARRRGLSVLVLERDERAVGASVRNFGHVCTTAQTGVARRLAERANEEWRRLGRDAGIPVRTDGTVVVARTAAEAAVLTEFAAERGDAVRLLEAEATADRLTLRRPPTPTIDPPST